MPVYTVKKASGIAGSNKETVCTGVYAI